MDQVVFCSSWLNKREKSPSLKELAGAPCPGIHREREGEVAERENHKKQKDGGWVTEDVSRGNLFNSGICKSDEFRAASVGDGSLSLSLSLWPEGKGQILLHWHLNCTTPGWVHAGLLAWQWGRQSLCRAPVWLFMTESAFCSSAVSSLHLSPPGYSPAILPRGLHH